MGASTGAMVTGRVLALAKRCRALGTAWCAPRTHEHLEALRIQELASALEALPAPRRQGRLLEIGAGAGWQSRALDEAGFDVVAVDVPSSSYTAAGVWPVIAYDGERLPFADGAFDLVFSSNTLEHVPELEALQAELRRVLKHDGAALHVVPSASWRAWSNLTHLIRRWTLPNRHGEHAANAWSELAWFRGRWWRAHFERCGWQVLAQRQNRLFYTGSSVLDARLGMAQRKRLSAWLGSACHIFVVRPTAPV